jgi:SAM-dependent methyltransferase
MTSPYGELVSRHGLSSAHALMLAAVPDGARVLDVGCATGYLAERLIARGCEVVGVEADPAAADLARGRGIEVVVGDVEDPAVRSALPGERDRVLFGDVLEHLRDPRATLVDARSLLSSGGRVVASLPNVAVWHARRELACGRFPHEDHGIFDRTHLRFFTRATAHELVRSAGYAVEREAFAPAYLPGEPLVRRLLGGREERPLPAVARLRARAAARRPELFALQIVLTLRPREPGREPAPPARSTGARPPR